MFKLLSCFFYLTPLLLFSQKNIEKGKSNTLTIIGEIHDFKETPEYIYAIFLDNNKSGLDSIRVKDGKYLIKRNLQSPTLVTLYAKNPEIAKNIQYKYMLTIRTEPTTIKIISKDSLSNSTIIGSKANKEYALLDSMSKQDIKQLMILYKAKANQNHTEISQQIDSVKNLISSIYYNYLLKNNNSLIKVFVLENYLFFLPAIPNEKEIEKANNEYNKLSMAEKKSFFGKKIKKELDSYVIEIGMIAPEFTQIDMNGNPISLKNYKGKYVLLDFWASWCAPCRRETPYLKKCFEKYKSKGFIIISVSLDSEKDRWLDAIQKDDMTWIQVSDLNFWNNKVAKLYKVSSIPSTFLIEPSGKIIAKNISMAELKEFLYKNIR